jgi:hypothetical protein
MPFQMFSRRAAAVISGQARKGQGNDPVVLINTDQSAANGSVQVGTKL